MVLEVLEVFIIILCVGSYDTSMFCVTEQN